MTIPNFTTDEENRIIEMAWEDRTPFEAICYQFSIRENVVVEIMRKQLKRSSFNLWRSRVHQGISKKNGKKRNLKIQRFKSSRQRSITNNKISKR